MVSLKSNLDDSIIHFLQKCQEAYYKGTPLITDEEFDTLADKYNFYEVGHTPVGGLNKPHSYRMYSLQKVYEEDGVEYPKETYIVSPKLDGSAISLEYMNGMLIKALTRGDGFIGEDITEKMILSDIVPSSIPILDALQITGEVVAEKTIENPRNYASGALHLKDTKEFLTRKLTFIAYGVQRNLSSSYLKDMTTLSDWGFNVVTKGSWDNFPQDGKVVRIDNYISYEEAGFTSKHPRGAFAIKRRKDVAIIPTTLREVVWQLGKGGKVTPVALFDPIVIEDANISRATLHNAGFVEQWDLHIGDRILITRSGGIIPKVVGKE